MRTIATAIAVAALASGCGTLSEQRKLDVGAAELRVTDTEILGAAKGNTKREFLGIVVNDSVQKCADFLGRLTLEQQTINATGDISATVFSALATVFTPLSTVHALTGASTIASGTKASLMNALYAKASIANFSSALQQTYAKDIGKYIEGLDDLDESKIIVSNEVARIRAIHAECSLAQAEATVTSTLAAASQPGAQKPSSPIAVTKRFEPPTVKPNDKSKLTITLANSSDSPAILTAPFVDTFPATMTIASPLNLGGDCQHQSIDATASKGSLTFRSGATIPRKGCTISVEVVATSTGKNVIAVDALQTNQGNNAAEASATLTVDATGTATPPTPAPAPPSAPSAKAATRATPTWGAPIQFR